MSLDTYRSASLPNQHMLGERIALLVGLLDGLAPLPYFLGIDPPVIQGPVIALKLALMLLFPAVTVASSRRTMLLAAIFVICIGGTMVDAFSPNASWQSIIRSWAFAVSMFGTISLISERHYLVYVKALAFLPIFAAALHICMAAAGLIFIQNGRHFYFMATHPNLGGEIAAIAAMAAAISLPLRWFIPASCILMYDSLLLQSRSAILVIFISIFVRLLYSYKGRRMLLLSALLLCVLLLTTNLPAFIESALQLNSQFRGFSSGFSGRDARWEGAIATFLEHPLLGAGLSAFAETPDAHNAFLYGLASNGALSILFWMSLSISLYYISLISFRDLIILSSGMLLLMFNDRYFNLNIFPMAYYVLIVCYPYVQGVRKWAPHP